MDQIEHISKYNLNKIFLLFNCENDGEITLAIVQQLQDWNLIYREGILKCPNGHFYRFSASSRSKDGFVWRCTETYKNKNKKRVRCNATLSLRRNTFLENSQLPLYKIVAFSYLWFQNVTMDFLINEIEICKSTALEWSSFYREVVIYAAKTNDKLGGPDTVVEIGESEIKRQKYHNGHCLEGQWIFGGVQRGTDQCFMVPVESRTMEGLLQLIKQHIKPNTTIISDCWKAYDCLNNERFLHLTDNYTIKCKDPLATSHTIDELWRHLRASLTECTRKKRFHEYLAKFVFKRNCRNNKLDLLSEFFKFANELKNLSVGKKLLGLDNSNESDSL